MYGQEQTIVIKKGQLKDHRVLRTVLRIVFTIALTVLCIAVIFLTVITIKFSKIVDTFFKDAVQTVNNSTLQTFKGNNTSYVYDASGSTIAKLRKDNDRFYLDYSALTVDVKNALIAIEDKRFNKHKGVDIQSTMKAAWLLIKNPNEIVRGGSTITQQLARNMFLSFEVSYERKLREIFLAVALEKKYGKEKVFEFYVNNINYANGYYGIGAAANGYFSKKISELTLAETALLCAIPNNPTYYNPIENLPNAMRRRNVILEQMFQQGMITYEASISAQNSPVKIKRAFVKFHNYESSYAIDCTVRKIMKEHDFSFRYSFHSIKDYDTYHKQYEDFYAIASDQLYSGGYRVQTSIDSTIQKKLQKSIDTELSGFKEKGKDAIFLMQGAATVIDNKNGMVVAIVGGRSQETNGVRTWNRAFQSYRQPGSAIKPLIVYTPAFEMGYTPDTTVNDKKVESGPRNSGDSYAGKISLRKAVEESRNVVAWKLFKKITPKLGLRYLSNMQFAKITPNDNYPTACLGGLYFGVNTVEMASAYATLANDGEYREATCVTSITNADGSELIYDRMTASVYEAGAARDMTDVLQGVANTGTAAGLDLETDMPLACKTGTTNEQTVAWFCGYTPYYSVAVYVGYDTNHSVDDLWGNTYPRKIWENIQRFLNKNKPIKRFETKDVLPAEEIEPKLTREPITEQETANEVPTLAPTLKITPVPTSTPRSFEAFEDSSRNESELGSEVEGEIENPLYDVPLPKDVPRTSVIPPLVMPSVSPTVEPEVTDEVATSTPDFEQGEISSDERIEELPSDVQDDMIESGTQIEDEVISD